MNLLRYVLVAGTQAEAKQLLAKFEWGQSANWRTQLKLKYSHHQQPQQHRHYD
jgi:hypothetical protein